MAEVWQMDLPHGEQYVLLALADHSDDRGSNIYPSLAYLSWKCGYKKRQIQNLIGGLKQRGILRVERKAGWHHPVTYRIDIKAAPYKDPFERVAKITTMDDLETQFASTKGAIPDARVAIRDDRVATAIATKPSLTVIEPSEDEEGVESENRPRPRRATASAGFQYPAWEQDADLRQFLLTQKFVEIPLEYFSDNAWWTNASIGCHGISVKFLERVFAALGNKFSERPQSRPMTRAGWLKKMTNFLRVEREIIQREEVKATRLTAPRRVAYAR